MRSWILFIKHRGTKGSITYAKEILGYIPEAASPWLIKDTVVVVDRTSYDEIKEKERRAQAALTRVLAECAVSTDKDFYEHIKTKSDRILQEGE